MRSLSVARRAATGFTLIELLVVISIIGLLSAFVSANVASARERALNAGVQQSVYQYVIGLSKIEAETGSFPVSDEGAGYYCLGGSDCGYTTDGDLNGTLSEQVSGAPNPNSQGILFEDEYRKAAYLRCDDDFSVCPDDSITEVLWYLSGTSAKCGYGATAYYDSGNTACFLHLEGEGTLVNEALEQDAPDAETSCSDGIDEDGDGATDCADGDCVNAGACFTSDEVGNCGNNTDDDNDGSTDCSDSDCSSDNYCYSGPTSESGSCSNGMDDDYDGMYDCGDSDCSGDGSCMSNYTETCNNGFDDDYDGMYDCSDYDCYYDSYCQNNSSGY